EQGRRILPRANLGRYEQPTSERHFAFRIGLAAPMRRPLLLRGQVVENHHPRGRHGVREHLPVVWLQGSGAPSVEEEQIEWSVPRDDVTPVSRDHLDVRSGSEKVTGGGGKVRVDLDGRK